MADLVSGIDVSHYEDSPEFHEVAAAGHSFVMIKATEALSEDPTFRRNRDAAKSAGLIVGFYHFFRYAVGWAEQVDTFINTVGNLAPGELGPILDLEDRRGIGQVGSDAGTRIALAAAETLHEALGKLPIIYCDPDFRKNYLADPDFARYLLWEASYQPAPPTEIAPWSTLTFWQRDEHGYCPGIAGEVDIDAFLGTLQELRELAGLRPGGEAMPPILARRACY